MRKKCKKCGKFLSLNEADIKRKLKIPRRDFCNAHCIREYHKQNNLGLYKKINGVFKNGHKICALEGCNNLVPLAFRDIISGSKIPKNKFCSEECLHKWRAKFNNKYRNINNLYEHK